MNIDFDMSQNVTAEFGVGQREGEVVQYSLMPVDDTVQDALGELGKQSPPSQALLK